MTNETTGFNTVASPLNLDAKEVDPALQMAIAESQRQYEVETRERQRSETFRCACSSLARCVRYIQFMSRCRQDQRDLEVAVALSKAEQLEHELDGMRSACTTPSTAFSNQQILLYGQQRP